MCLGTLISLPVRNLMHTTPSAGSEIVGGRDSIGGTREEMNDEIDSLPRVGNLSEKRSSLTSQKFRGKSE
jgi:hypothetical protein